MAVASTIHRHLQLVGEIGGGGGGVGDAVGELVDAVGKGVDVAGDGGTGSEGSSLARASMSCCLAKRVALSMPSGGGSFMTTAVPLFWLMYARSLPCLIVGGKMRFSSALLAWSAPAFSFGSTT